MEPILSGKNAVVCGASQGIGRAVALYLAELGANVAILSRSKDKLNIVLEELKKFNGFKHSAYPVDLEKSEDVMNTADSILSDFNDVHILVNNSGGPKPGKISDSKEAELLNAFGAHVIASQVLMQKFLPGMKAAHFGRIINIISIGMKEPIENLGVSNTIRGAMGSWAKTLSREVAPFGITVNNLLPGHTLTPRLESLFENRSKIEGHPIDEIKARMVAEIPAGRFGKPEDLAYIAGFLASDMAGFITGTSIPVDGGWLHGL